MPLSSHPQQRHNVSTILAGLNKHADTMALAQPSSSSASDANARSQSEKLPAQQRPPLPTPQLFDILPALHETLARLDHTPTGLADPLQLASVDDTAVYYADLQPLDRKDLPTAILPLKAQMRKGLREVEKLPDMERSVQDQEDEIAELEERIRRQEAVMQGLAQAARGVGGKVRREEQG
ncbi:hypothetical protein LTR85_010515 [Meristemomyces frigidus]|nr:hypothetical protein LTR85_010515 [Meristemomyces frigidus]